MGQIARILIFAASLWRYYLGISALTIIVTLLTLLPPFLVKEATDEIVKIVQGQSGSQAVVVWSVLGIFFSGTAAAVLSNYSGYLGDVMAVKLRRILSEKYYEHLLALPQRYFDSELSGKIINRLNRSIEDITSFMNIFTNNFFSMLLTAIITIVIVAFYSWELALLIAMLYPIFLFLTMRTSKKWMVYQTKKNHHLDVSSGRFAEAIGQIKVVKSFSREKGELRLFSDHFGKFVHYTYPQSRMWHWQDVLRRTVLEVIFFGIFMFIIYRTYQGVFSLGVMFMLLQYAMNVRMPIFSMSFIVDNTQKAIAGSRDFFEVMETVPQIADETRAKVLKVDAARIDFADVSFSYKKGNQVLRNITFTVRPDTKVALVGESGQGKTTLTNLLMRFYALDSGEIRIDGQPIAEVTQKSLRRAIGVVFQEPNLFSGTIHENIAYARPSASRQEVVTAAKAANAHDFIEKFSDGYETEIGERGVRLSGGQKQRIAIARAILKDAPILLLDEATSSLDSRSERVVQDALERLMKGRTTIIIAHRLSTIAHVDQIVTLKDGTVDEIGSPAELAKTDGIYGQLLRLQGASTAAQKRELKKFDIAIEGASDHVDSIT